MRFQVCTVVERCDCDVIIACLEQLIAGNEITVYLTEGATL